MRTALALAVLFVASPMRAQGQVPPVAVDVFAGYRNIGGPILRHTFATRTGTPPITWVNLTVVAGSPAIAPFLGSDGQFEWLLQGSEFGFYRFDVTARNTYGSDIGSISLDLVPGGAELTPPVAVDAYLGSRLKGSMIDHTFTLWSGAEPVTWSNVEILSAPGTPINVPSLTSNGNFLWDSHGSPVGSYSFSVLATNFFGSDTAMLHMELIPEPETWLLLSIASVAWFRFSRRQANAVL